MTGLVKKSSIIGVERLGVKGESSIGEVRNSNPGEVMKSDMGEVGEPRPKELIAPSDGRDGGGMRTESGGDGIGDALSADGESVGFVDSILR